MRTTSITYRKKKRGVSTVLGTLIFIGILFTSVIPMMLVMKQADTIYAQKVHEMSRQDDERDRENINVYTYPEGSGSSNINIEIENDCELAVEIARIWINNTYTPRNDTVKSMKTEVLGPIPIPIQEGMESSYFVQVTTKRGNVYSSQSGTIYYNGTDWMAETLGICVVIGGEGSGGHWWWWWGFGRYNVTVTNVTDTYIDYCQSQETSFTTGTVSLYFDVTIAGPGTYKVYIEKWERTGWWTFEWVYKDQKNVEISWPSGPAVEWVYFG
jgi:archaellum component FlaF (FlaF/FlaG flagellin family)